MSTKHTPGPWEIGEYPFADPEIAIVTKDQTVANLDQGYYDKPIPDAEIRANAALIAAAPEMLEALQAVLGRGFLENKYPASQDYVSKSAIAKVRAAIRKAERPE